jgi:uncharacterized OB-fold protein
MTNGGKEEILISERNFDSIFSYTAGTIRSKFLTEIRDSQKIIGTRCPECNLVWVPARSICVKCFSNLHEFVTVSDTGTLTTYSVVKASQPFYLENPPFVLGIIQLDGADNGLVHFINETKPEELEIGMRLKAVFRENRIGSILDIEYFKPVRE